MMYVYREVVTVQQGSETHHVVSWYFPFYNVRQLMDSQAALLKDSINSQNFPSLAAISKEHFTPWRDWQY
jgi:hypothetical protein